MQLLVSVVGPTAVGKTSFAIELAKHFDTEILSVDSRQFYRELEIGTAKPTSNELDAVKHHLINSHSITESVSAGSFEKQALAVLNNLFKKHSVVVAVGGSGLYFQTLWNGMDDIPLIAGNVRKQLQLEYEAHGLDNLLTELTTADPEFVKVVDKKNPQRIIRALEVIRGTGKKYSSFRGNKKRIKRPFENLKIGLKMDREILYQRIDDRMEVMIQSGLFEEADRLKAYKAHNALQTVGYTEIFEYFEGNYDKEEAIRLLKRNSRRYAKRQFTWFNKDPEIVWMEPSEISKAKAIIANRLSI